MPFVIKNTESCPVCKKPVYFGEKILAAGASYHRLCFKCTNPACSILLTPGKESIHEYKPYCNRCHLAIFGPKGFGRGGVESHVFCDGKTGATPQ